VSGRGGLDQAQSEAVIGLLEHMESFPVAQITQDIHGQVVTPVTHEPRGSPALGVGGRVVHGADLLTEGADILQNVALNAAHGAVGEGLGEDAALAGVQLLVAGIVGVGDGVGKGVVELGLADVGAEAVDVLERRARVERDRVGAEADSLAVLLVQAPELEVTVAAPGVVEVVGVGDLGQDGAGVPGERVEEDAVDDEADGLDNVLVSCLLLLQILLCNSGRHRKRPGTYV
jgi:hypothetical protein